MLSTSVAACEGHKMRWVDARALGVFIWLRSVDTMVKRSLCSPVEPLLISSPRNLIWKSLHGTSIWLVITVTLRNVASSILR